MRKYYLFLFIILNACNSPDDKKIKIGFLDLLQDETLMEAKRGFFVALNDSGFTNENIEIIYRNAQNDQSSLLLACDYMISQNVKLIATNPTLSTITAVQRTNQIPIFMMVSPRPDIAKLIGLNGNIPPNLFGTYETLDYIDTSVMLIKSILPDAKKVGTIFNQSEPQSVDALKEIEKQCAALGLELEKLPVNNSNETQIVVAALLEKKIDAFFALPDNTVFSAMEVIVKKCDERSVPVFTSEEGLVKRGAVAAFGADMYQWGYQSGAQATQYLKTQSTKGLKPEIVKIRKRVYNKEKTQKYHLTFDSSFVAVGAD
jgi:putative tryptophan/tyrosine transport system substrate-binding protein